MSEEREQKKEIDQRYWAYVKRQFKRKKTATRSVRLDESMLKDAEKKARKERSKTGGTFNGLVEVLVWRYLNCPTQYVETE